MKKLWKKAALISAAALVGLFCLGATAKKPKQVTDILDNKGAALGIPTPSWVTASVMGGNIAVEALPEYKDLYCFVISAESPDKDFLLAWTGNLNGPAAIANVIAQTVSEDVKGKSSNIEGGARERAISRNAEAMSNASYTGARKMADWWQLVRNKKTKAQTYQAFVLYTFDRKVLNDQIARNLQNIMDNNAEISAAERAIYTDLIQGIRSRGYQSGGE